MSRQRIRILVDHQPAAPAALQWVAELARQMQAELDACFIEDSQLFQVASLPFTFSSHAHEPRRRLTVDSLSQDLQGCFLQLQRQLEGLQSEMVSVSRRRGRYLEELRRAWGEVNLLFLPGAATTSAFERMVGRGIARPMFMLFDGSVAAAGALRTLLPYTREQGLHLLLQVEDRDEAERLRQQVEVIVAGSEAGPISYSHLPRHDGAHLLHLLRLEGAGVLFLASNNPLLADHPLQLLLQQLPCPLVVVNPEG